MSLPSARPIAFNRRLRASWLMEGLRLLSSGVENEAWVENMRSLISAEITGRDSIQKSLRYLRHTFVEPGPLQPLRAEAVSLSESSRDPARERVLAWGLAVACYPFLNEIAATVGRMLRVQHVVKLEQLLRKLTESFGERETVRRSGRYSLSLIEELGFVSRTDKAGYYCLAPPLKVTDSRLAAWFMKAWFLATNSSGPIDRVALTSHPSLAFFDAASIVDNALSQGVVTTQRLSYSQETVRLKNSSHSAAD